MRSTTCFGRVSLTAALILFTGGLTSACAQTQDSDPAAAVDEGSMSMVDLSDSEGEPPVRWADLRPDVATVPVVQEAQLDQREMLFLSFWEGMTPAQYVYVAHHLTTNPLFQPGEPGQDDRFRVAGVWVTVTPSFGEAGLVDIRLEEQLVAFRRAESVFDLYSSKYGSASHPIHNRASEAYRRVWAVMCEGAERSTVDDIGPGVWFSSPGCRDGKPVDLPGDPTSWSDGVRTVTLSFDGGTFDPTGPFHYFNDLTLRYTMLRRAEIEQREASDRDERSRLEHRQAREQERLQRAAEAQAETDGI